jgi:hypothetical protein
MRFGGALIDLREHRETKQETASALVSCSIPAAHRCDILCSGFGPPSPEILPTIQRQIPKNRIGGSIPFRSAT